MAKEYNIAVLPGDGVGPEIIEQGIKVLHSISGKYGHKFNFHKALVGGAAIEKTGVPLPEDTLILCKRCDAVYLGAVGDVKYNKIDPSLRPEQALLKLRKELDLYANLRPVNLFKELSDSSPLKEEYIENVDIMIVRELTGGLYFGQPRGIEADGERKAYNTMSYTESEIERIARASFKIARSRRNMLCSVDKANVLEVSRLWREIVEKVSQEFPDVELSHMYVDNAAMQLIKNPQQFDVILTENMFGDILSDEASMLAGSLGLLASASLSDSSAAMYEPIHGSAPDIAGQNIANPIATILSAAMMLKYSFNLNQEAHIIESAIQSVLADGFRTKDILSKEKKLIGTSEMGDLIADKILNI